MMLQQEQLMLLQKLLKQEGTPGAAPPAVDTPVAAPLEVVEGP